DGLHPRRRIVSRRGRAYSSRRKSPQPLDAVMDPHRLPRAVVPTRYELTLEPDLAAAAFTGEATVSLRVREPVADVVCNAAGLAADRPPPEPGAGSWQRAVVPAPEPERCPLPLPVRLAPGDYRLRLRFRGTLNDKLRGFYRSTYRDAAGTFRTLAATQF